MFCLAATAISSAAVQAVPKALLLDLGKAPARISYSAAQLVILMMLNGKGRNGDFYEMPTGSMEIGSCN